MTKRLRLQAASRWAVFVASMWSAVHVAEAGCNPTFGDEVKRWVDEDAYDVSRDFSSSDYETRTFNLQLISMEQIHASVDTLRQELDRMGTDTDTAEKALPSDATLAAIRRQQDAQQRLSKLFELRSRIVITRAQLTRLTAKMSLLEFRQLGLHYVGVHTMLESFHQMGSAAESFLGTRYGIYVSVTFNDEGELTETSISGGSDEQNDYEAGGTSLAYAIAQKYPAVYAIIAVYYIGKFVHEDEKCRRAVRRQQEKMRNALIALTDKLPKTAEQYKMYSDLSERSANQFSAHGVLVASTLDALEGRLQALFAYQAQRMAASHAVLTATKISELTGRLERDPQGARAIVQTNLTIQLGRELNALRQGLVAQEVVLARADPSAQFEQLRAGERLLDYSEYSHEIAKAFKSVRAHLALDTTLNELSNEARKARNQAEAVLAPFTWPHVRRANTATPPPGPPAASPSRRNPDAVLRTFVAGTPLHTAAAPSALALSRPQSLCAIASQDGIYRCSEGSGAGRTYGNEFQQIHGDAYSNIAGAAGDGGYAEDNRRVSRKIADVEENILNRISAMDDRLAAVKRAIPEWQSRNDAALATMIAKVDEGLAGDARSRQDFTERNAELVSASQNEITAFAQTRADDTSYEALLREVGGTALSLPEISMASVPASAVEVTGVTAILRAYGNTTNPTMRQVMQERAKAEAAMDPASTAFAMSARVLHAAEKFARESTPQSRELTTRLLADAASARFAGIGLMPRASATLIGDGNFSETPIDVGASLPPDSIMARLTSFEMDVTAVEGRIAIARATLQPDLPDYRRRRAAVDLAEEISETSRREFYRGSIEESSTLLKFAHPLLDLATAWTPGVSWGRDIYEAITGEDLISGEKLQTWMRVGAVIGAVTAGVGSKPLEMIKSIGILRRIGISAEKAKVIVQATEHIDPHALDYGVHAVERMKKHGIDEDAVQEALEIGERFYDTVEDSVAFSAKLSEKEEVTVIMDYFKKNFVITTYPGLVNDAVDAAGIRRFVKIPRGLD